MKSSAPDSSPPLALPAVRAPALWQQIDLAARGLQQVAAGHSAREVLAGWPQSPARAGAQALLYTTLRHWGQARALLALLAPRRPQRHVEAVLAVALALLVAPADAAYAPFTVVNQAVQALRQHRRFAAQAGFANACLRRFLREQEALLAALADDSVARWNHPAWWIEALRRDHPAHWQAILQANNARAPLTLRVNTAQLGRDAYLAQLQQAGIAATPVLEAGVVLAQPIDVRRLPGYVQGWFSVQDAAAQLAAGLLLAQTEGRRDGPLRVLDACAAPGGKTAHLLEWAAARQLPIELVALDIDAQRCLRVEENLQRLGLPGARVAVADAGQPQAWAQHLLGGKRLDRVLLDAPCSASGIVRRHADIRWLRRAEDIEALARTQAQLLQRLWPLLEPGGRLLYCTCSVFHREGQQQIQQFLAAQADARLVVPWLQLLPASVAPVAALTGAGEHGGFADGTVEHGLQGSHDGFFYALLEKE